ncbi:MAG TPA: CDP-alcohol phosphatidyltransferase family protein [Bellilinea sp.]|nr:CDP-alcohol phosphatidyltransferase family protein [Bellilinea sp.]
MQETPIPQKQTFTDQLRVIFKGLLDGIAKALLSIGLTPNQVTVAGLLFHIVAAYLAAKGYFLACGLMLLLLAPTDAVDGTMARLSGKVSSFGGFLDSVIDRYSELVLFGGLVYYGITISDGLFVMAAFLSAVGAIMVSYTRARGEAAGFDVKIGLLSRVERYIVLIPFLIVGVPFIALAILAIFTNTTAIHRILEVRRQASLRDKSTQ